MRSELRWLALCLAALLAALPIGRSSAAQQGGAEAEPLPPEELKLTTKDRVELGATYYPSRAGKEAIPVILLHMHEGRRSDYSALAQMLQKELDCAVIVPDLRGHGESTRVTGGGRELDAKRLAREHFMAMWHEDVEAVKRFLLEKNNAGELNIDQLCIVGAEMSAVVALNWAQLDWSYPVLATGRQGQYVKALVLLSPEVAFRTVSAQEALQDRNVLSELSVYIVVGERDGRSMRTAERVHGLFERYHPEPPADRVAEEKDLFFDTFETSLKGTALLGAQLGLEQRMLKFIELRLKNHPQPWMEHKKPI